MSEALNIGKPGRKNLFRGIRQTGYGFWKYSFDLSD
jgi:hypothetical protein